MVISYFDIFIILLTASLTGFYWKRPLMRRVGCLGLLGSLFLFGFLLPLLSLEIEFRLYAPPSVVTFDAFTMLYTYLKFPLYWSLFVLWQLVLLFRPQ